MMRIARRPVSAPSSLVRHCLRIGKPCADRCRVHPGVTPCAGRGCRAGRCFAPSAIQPTTAAMRMVTSTVCPELLRRARRPEPAPGRTAAGFGVCLTDLAPATSLPACSPKTGGRARRPRATTLLERHAQMAAGGRLRSVPFDEPARLPALIAELEPDRCVDLRPSPPGRSPGRLACRHPARQTVAPASPAVPARRRTFPARMAEQVNAADLKSAAARRTVRSRSGHCKISTLFFFAGSSLKSGHGCTFVVTSVEQKWLLRCVLPCR